MKKRLKASVSPLHLALRHAFRIAHGTSNERTNARVQLEYGDGQVAGLGEGALPPYYPWSLRDIEQYVETLPLDRLDITERDHASVHAWLHDLPDGPGPARAAVDMAVHDAWARNLGLPLHAALGLSERPLGVSTYALPIPESLAELDDMLADVSDFPFLKLKLGCGDPAFDIAIVRRARSVYTGALCVDVNSGWSAEQALSCISALEDCMLTFIEQPVASSWDELHGSLTARGTRQHNTLVADESVQGLDSIQTLAPYVDGINIKLAKCGGLSAALDQARLARHLGLKCMLGCMIESAIALTAAAQIGSLFDWLDLDGTMHTAADPYEGLQFDRGHIRLPDGAGLGVTPRRATSSASS